MADNIEIGDWVNLQYKELNVYGKIANIKYMTNQWEIFLHPYSDYLLDSSPFITRWPLNDSKITKVTKKDCIIQNMSSFIESFLGYDTTKNQNKNIITYKFNKESCQCNLEINNQIFNLSLDMTDDLENREQLRRILIAIKGY